MGRGKQWNDAETKALIEAYVHISEDAMVGINQSSDQLYVCVSEEAKKQFTGDWMCPPHACKNRWQDVSKEVQKFCTAMKLVESVEHSGWNDDDYYKAAEEYYCAHHGDTVTKFKFVEEWEFLKGYEKWKTLTSPTLKQSKEQGSSSESSGPEHIPTPWPIGNKKAKAMASLEAKAEE